MTVALGPVHDAVDAESWHLMISDLFARLRPLYSRMFSTNLFRCEFVIQLSSQDGIFKTTFRIPSLGGPADVEAAAENLKLC